MLTSTYVVADNYVYKVHSTVGNPISGIGYLVYDRTQTSGLKLFKQNEINELVYVNSDDFQKSLKKFEEYTRKTSFKHMSEDLHDESLKTYIDSVIHQAIYEDNIINEYEDHEVNTEDTCYQTLEFLSHLKQLSPNLNIVRMYVYEQILQKFYYHKYNDTWIYNKKLDSRLDMEPKPHIPLLTLL